MIDFNKKLAGVLIPVFALRGKNDLGIGDTKSMQEAVDFCARNKLSVLQVLPINETGGDHSPYNAISSVALDPVLMSLEPAGIPGMLDGDIAEIITSGALEALRAGPVKYPAVKKLKLALLKKAFDRFTEKKEQFNKEWQELKSFCEKHKRWLEPYALFRLLVEHYDGNSCWTSWSTEHASPAAAQAWLNTHPEQANLEAKRQFFCYVQWLAFKQWQYLRDYADSQNIALMGDIPFGISRYSADVWAERELFDLTWSGGAPPEPFFATDEFIVKWGQNWGIPLYSWETHADSHWWWWRQRIENLTSVFHYFRIDHVLGLFRIYAFPWAPEQNKNFVQLDEKEAKALAKGRLPGFKPRPDKPEDYALLNAAEGKERLAIIQGAAGKNGLVAEDLGVVPDYVRPLLVEMGIPGFSIPIFERDEQTREFKEKAELEKINLATYGTHDHLPLRSYYEELVKQWHGPDGHEGWLEVQRLMRFLGLNDEHPPESFTAELHETFLRVLLETPCWLAIYMITDILGTDQRFNLPGSSGDENWSQRLEHDLVFYEQQLPYRERLACLSSAIVKNMRVHESVPAGKIG